MKKNVTLFIGVVLLVCGMFVTVFTSGAYGDAPPPPPGSGGPPPPGMGSLPPIPPPPPPGVGGPPQPPPPGVGVLPPPGPGVNPPGPRPAPPWGWGPPPHRKWKYQSGWYYSYYEGRWFRTRDWRRGYWYSVDEYLIPALISRFFIPDPPGPPPPPWGMGLLARKYWRYHNGWYFAYYNGNWYRAHYRRGPWYPVAEHVIPLVVRRVFIPVPPPPPPPRW